MFEKITISFIGAGHLGSALIRGLIKGGFPAHRLIVSNKTPEKVELLAKTLGITPALNNRMAAESADVVFLAVKPQFIQKICQEISLIIQKRRPLVISLAGVVPIEDMLSTFGADDLGMVRVMTNTPTEFCKGTTALFAHPAVTPYHKELTQSLFNTIGTSFWVEKESTLNVLTAPVGCSPAYVFLFLEALQEAAVKRGIPQELAKQIALSTMMGAAELAKHSKEPFATLREKVTTPDGVTARSLLKLPRGPFFESFSKVYEAAEERIKEIEETLRSRL